MLKLLGAIIVISASTVYGFYKAASYGKRLAQLKQLIYSLKRLRTEIQFGLTPLPDAFLHIGHTSSAPFSDFFTRISTRLAQVSSDYSFAHIWQEELTQARYDTDLLERHFDILEQLGAVLGTSDALDQQQHLQTAIERLLLEENLATEEKVRYVSLWRSIGALTGVTLVILLI